MTSAAKAPSEVSSRYAVALMDLAQEAKILDSVEVDMGELQSMIGASDDLSFLITSPLLGRAQKEKAVSALAEKADFQDLTKNFLGVLSQNGRLNALEDIIDAFSQELARRRGEVTVNVQTAQDLDPDQAQALSEAVSKAVGSGVTLNVKVEPDILGGMIVTVGSHMIDDSVARKLERLKAAMSKQSNQNVVSKKAKGA